MHLKVSSAEVVCCKYLPSITDELSIEANRVDPEHTVPIGAVRSGSILFAIEASYTFQQKRKQTTFLAIGALRVKSLFQLRISGVIKESNGLDPDQDYLSVRPHLVPKYL